METSPLKQYLLVFGWLLLGCLSACQTSTAPAASAESVPVERKSLAPQRVDIRGSITQKRYDQGQMLLEVEGFPSADSRYNRAYVLVTPVTQIINAYGQTISLSELQHGQQVAIFLRSGGKGNQLGVGVARKMWIEE